MTQDEIVTMARKAGLVRAGDKWVEPARWGVTELIHFAALVAAHEREECAKVCDTMQKVGHEFWAPEDAEVEQGVRAGAAMCAAAIRSRT